MSPEKAALLSAISATASALIALAALVVAVLATKANKDSAAASLRSAEVAERALAMATQVRWKLTRLEGRSGAHFLLTNAGGAVAYGVDLGGASISVPGGDRRDSVGPDEGVTIISTRSINDTDFDLIVTWYDDPELSGEQQTWRHSLV